MLFRRLVVLSVVGLGCPASGAPAPSARVVVRGQGTDLGETPVVVAAPSSLPPGRYQLRSDANPSINATIFRDGQDHQLAAVIPTIPARAITTYRLEATEGAGPGGIGVQVTPSSVAATFRGRPFTTYVAGVGPKPFFFPLVGPDDREVTRSYPMKEIPGETRDHVHHRSLWFTHGDVNGVDFWAETPGRHGSIRETSRRVVDGGHAVAILRTTDDWAAPDGTIVGTDRRSVRLFATEERRFLDFEFELVADHGPITLGDTKEGTFGLRVATSMDADKLGGGKITNADGLVDAAAWGKPSRWVDYAGPIGGQVMGIAILDHPTSLHHPTPWHVRTYGLFAANPIGRLDFGLKDPGPTKIPAGGSARFAYRVILHRGPTATAGIPAAFEGYAHPPVVEVSVD